MSSTSRSRRSRAHSTPPTASRVVPALAAGDGVNTNDVAFGQRFPYLALPHSGSTTGNGSLGGGTTSGSTGPRGFSALNPRGPVEPLVVPPPRLPLPVVEPECGRAR